MKKLLSVFLVCSMLIVFASCGEDSADYSKIAVPVHGLYWGINLVQAKELLKEQKITYIEKEEKGIGDIQLQIENEKELYGIAIQSENLYFSNDTGLIERRILFSDNDETVLLDALAKKYGEYKEDERSSSELRIWCVPITLKINTLKNQELLNEVEKFYLELLSPAKDEVFTVSREEQLEKFLDSPFVAVSVWKNTKEESLYMYFEGDTAAMLKNIEELGAKGYYNKLLENKG